MAKSMSRGALALTLFVTLTAVAEEPADEVVVTATRFRERAIDVPIGVRVITASDIARSAARTLPEILAQLGGLHIRNISGSPDQQLDLRGFGITGDQNTLVLLDGVRVSEMDLASPRLSNIPLQSIERIEILPGGGAVQYGSGTTGGTINIITRQPLANTLNGTVEAGYGTYATNDLRASVNAGSERLGLVAYGNAYDTDGYRDNNAFRQRNMLANVRYAGESGSIGARIGASDQNLRLPGALTEAEIAANPRQSDTPDNFSKFNGALAALNGAYRTGDVELAADLAYRDTVSEANFAGAFPSYLQSSSHTTQFSPRARWDLARLGADSQFVAGVDWFDASFTRRIADTSSDLNAPFSQVESTQRASAGYTQFLWQVTERTRVNLGARVARVETDLRTVIPGPIAVQDQSRTLNAYEGALRYALSSLVSISGRLSRSYRLPTVDENGFTSTGLLLEPQTAKQGDVGVELRASTFSARATAYLIKLHNEIYFSPLINPPFGANTNLPPTERRGLELAARWVSTPMLELGGSLNLQQATYSSGVLGGVDLSGKDVPLVPRVLGTLRASWLFQPQARLSATYTYVGHERYDNDQANTYPQEMPTYGLLDLKLSYDIDRWLLAASVANALNQHYYSYGIVNLSNCPTFCAYPQAGRTFFASVEYRFR